MKDRDKVLNEIIEFAKENENIRALVLQGSLINPSAKIDYFSDIDPLFYAIDPSLLANHTKWISKFGDVMINLFDEELDINDSMHYMRMVIYENGLKVDFGIASIDVAKYANKMPLFKVILDKDNILPTPKTTDDSSFHIIKPSNKDYQLKLNDFFWDSTYIAKALCRNETYFAHFMESNLHIIMRPIIEWYIGLDHNFKVNTGLEGRYFQSLLSKGDCEKVKKTYSDSNPINSFKAIYSSYNLIKHIGKKIEKELNYIYPIEKHNKVLNYIKKIEQMN